MRAAIARLLSLLALAGCGPSVQGVSVQLVTQACPGAAADGSRNPVTAVDKFTFTVSGDGLVTSSTDVPFSSGSLQIPNLPLGIKRRIVVEARAGRALRSRADSGLFDLTGTGDLHLTLFLRVVDAFTPTGTADGMSCTRMTTPRAGHALALLPDGRVLITGGFSLDAGNQLHYHDDAEIFDPATAAFSALAARPTVRRSGHAALPVTLGTSGGAGVLIAGGEGPLNASGSGPVSAVKLFELFSGGAFTALQPAATSPAREHQAAAVDLKTGSAVFVGGQSGSDAAPGVTVYDTATWFEPRSGQIHDAALHLRAGSVTDAVAVARANKQGMAALGGLLLVGGRDAQLQASNQLSGLIFSDSAQDYVDDPALQSLHLPRPLVLHAAVRRPVDDVVLVAGGLTAAPQVSEDYANATAQITLVDPAAGSATALPQPLSQARADSCAVVLGDGSALVIGGAWKDPTNLQISGTTVDLVGVDNSVRPLIGPGTPAGASWELRDGRHRAACLRLGDGSVLVTGGQQFDATGKAQVLDTAEIYMPVGAPGK